jgi:hypothetical protein
MTLNAERAFLFITADMSSFSYSNEASHMVAPSHYLENDYFQISKDGKCIRAGMAIASRGACKGARLTSRDDACRAF